MITQQHEEAIAELIEVYKYCVIQAPTLSIADRVFQAFVEINCANAMSGHDPLEMPQEEPHGDLN